MKLLGWSKRVLCQDSTLTCHLWPVLLLRVPALLHLLQLSLLHCGLIGYRPPNMSRFLGQLHQRNLLRQRHCYRMGVAKQHRSPWSKHSEVIVNGEGGGGGGPFPHPNTKCK